MKYIFQKSIDNHMMIDDNNLVKITNIHFVKSHPKNALEYRSSNGRSGFYISFLHNSRAFFVR